MKGESEACEPCLVACSSESSALAASSVRGTKPNVDPEVDGSPGGDASNGNGSHEPGLVSPVAAVGSMSGELVTAGLDAFDADLVV